MTDTITDTGIYDLPNQAYHSQPGDGPCLSSSDIRNLSVCPARFHAHWSGNPARIDPPTSAALTFGSAAHALMLEGHNVFRTRYAAPPEKVSLRSAAGQAWKRETIAAGLEPLSAEDFATMEKMRLAIDGHAIASRLLRLDGAVEQSYIHRRKDGIFALARPDRIAHDGSLIVDYKTAREAGPDAMSRAIYQLGYHIRAAFALDVVEAVTGRRPEQYIFVVQEKTPPYEPECYALEAAAIDIGARRCVSAIELFHRCREAGHWPGHTGGDITPIGLPAWAYHRQGVNHV